MCVVQANEQVDANKARCGNPVMPPNYDKATIRLVINLSIGKYDDMNEAVELNRLLHFVSYPFDSFNLEGEMVSSRSMARTFIKNAIEDIIAFIPDNHKLTSFDKFLKEKILSNPGFSKVTTNEGHFNNVIFPENTGGQDYYIANENETVMIDVYKEWTGVLKHVVHEMIFCKRKG